MWTGKDGESESGNTGSLLVKEDRKGVVSKIDSMKGGTTVKKRRTCKTAAALLCAVSIMCGGLAVPVHAEGRFDPVFYAAMYPDVVSVLGTDAQTLLKHYQDYGRKEGRLPYEGAAAGEAVNGTEPLPAPEPGSAVFDPAFYASAYPDVTATLGTDAQTLLKHYQEYGRKEGRKPCAEAAPGAAVNGMADTSVPAAVSESAGLVPLNRLANLSSLCKKATNEELAQAYDIAAQIVTPYIGLDRQDQLMGITTELRSLFDSGMTYSMSAPHYNDPYGYFVLHTASCAGCARATGMCLNMLGIPYEHVNANQYSHQWCRVNVDGEYWICDAYGLYCGPEPAPYTHPYL